jgi:PAS domain S-box-containing protein
LRNDELPAQQAARGIQVQDFEFSLVFDDGTTRDVVGYGTPLRNQQGHPRGAVHVLVDITERKRAEEELQTTLHRLHTLVENIQSSILLVGDEGRIIFANQTFCDYFKLQDSPADLGGVTADEMIEKIKNAYLHPDEEVVRIKELLRQGQRVTGEEIAMRHGRTCLRDFIPISVGGKSFGRLWQHTDITERKRAEEALRKAHEQLEMRVQERTAELGKQSRILEGFFKSTITPLVFLDRNFNFIRVNEAYAKSYQRDKSEFQGHNHFEFYPHEENEAIFRRVVETNVPYQATAKPFTFPDHPEWGTTYWDWTLTPLSDSKGEVEFLVFSLEDVTERRGAELALQEASLYTRTLIEASIDPLVTISGNGKIADVNRATELATGLSRDALIGTDFSDYFTEPEKAREGYEQVFSKGSVRDYPLTIRHTSGRVIEVLYNATVYNNEAGEMQGVFAAARDVTERKYAEEALREAHDQVRFFASQCLTTQETERRRIAGELHDSIAASLGAMKFRIDKMAEEMKQGQGSPESMQDLGLKVTDINNEVRRIMFDLRPSILDDLGIIPAMDWFCREYQKTYSHISVEKQIGLAEHDVPDSLKTPIFRISQEAMNNTAKHGQACLVTLTVQKEHGRIQLTIQDNGQGFDSETVRKGLGLSTMRERAQLSGGSFDIESTIGKGTLIRVSWPLASG